MPTRKASESLSNSKSRRRISQLYDPISRFSEGDSRIPLRSRGCQFSLISFDAASCQGMILVADAVSVVPMSYPRAFSGEATTAQATYDKTHNERSVSVGVEAYRMSGPRDGNA
jgi:hypothetical protein